MSNLSLDAESIKRRCADPATVAHAFGLDEGARRQHHGLMVRCPWHAERTPSCSLTIGPDGTLRAHCFGCSRSGDLFTLAAVVVGLDVRADFSQLMREVVERCGLDRAARPLPSRRKMPPPRRPPPLGEVGTLWARCLPVCENPELARALFDLRGLDPATITDRDLARSLPLDDPLPSWARHDGKSWRDSAHTLILPLFDAMGELQSVHARSLQPDANPKGLSPAGHSSAGLILACPFGRLLLGHGIPTWWNHSAPPAFIISEGCPDFLTIACHYGAWECAPTTIGVISGAWSAAVAARIPDGSRVVIRTHSDEAGMKYRRQIAESLCHRCPVEVRHYGE